MQLKKVLLSPGWSDSREQAIQVTIHEISNEEIERRERAKSVDDAFAEDHLTDRQTWERTAHEQAQRCLHCGGPLDGEAQYLAMDEGTGLYCARACSPLRAFVRASEAARAEG